ncbi:von Willebrand factor A domain-containing protein 7-like [Mytilus trossulus]|uniref:von Willebrand factor A domain-containing protein 7-like n=1 Tax=Mytilus trossulus TaxID=6551 RepID=UPI0030077CDA
MKMHVPIINVVLGISLICPSVQFLFMEFKYPTYHTHSAITKEAIARAAVSYITGNPPDAEKSAVAVLDTIFGKDETARENYGEVVDLIISSMSERFKEVYNNPTHIMADELIAEGNTYLIKTRQTIIELSTKDKLDINFITDLIGRYLLTLQMFYCNTNWVEIEHNKICENLGMTDKFDVPLSDADEASCRNCNDEKEGDCKYNLITKKLTSGYLELKTRGGKGGNKPWNNNWRDVGKCSHGGTLDVSTDIPARGGINKETPEYLLSPHYFLHNNSGNAAITASVHFLVDKENGLVSSIGTKAFEGIFHIRYLPPVVKEKNTTVAFSTMSTHSWVSNRRTISTTKSNGNTVSPSTIKTSTRKPISVANFVYQPACYNCFQQSLSLILVIDNTGSMSDDIFQVRGQAIDIVKKAYSSQLYNYILVTFNDPVNKNTFYQTSDGQQILNRLNQLTVDGGDDCPEYAFTGLQTAITHANNGSCAFLFTDADPKDHFLCESVGRLIEQKNIHLVTFLTGVCSGDLKKGKSSDCIQTKQQPISCSSHRRKRSPTFGGFFAGLGGTIIAAPDREITQPLKTLLEKNMDIKYVFIAKNKMESNEFSFPVDAYLSVLVIEINGTSSKRDIRLVGPSNIKKIFKGRDTLDYIGRNTFIASIMNPQEGMWTLENDRRSTWFVQVKGQGDLEIKVKLLERFEGSLLDISGKPLSGHNITIAVSVAGLNETTNLESVIIYSENQTELQRQPVEVYSDFKENIAVADFKVPFQDFWVTVEGHDDSNIFQRTTENPFQPSVADIEILSDTGELYSGMISNISCNVTNFGTKNETFIVTAVDDLSYLTSQKTQRVFIPSGDSEIITFTIRGGNIKSVTTVKISVNTTDNRVLQQKVLKYMVSEFVPPTLNDISMSSMCILETMNFENCSYQNIGLNVSVQATLGLQTVYCKPNSIDVEVTNGTETFLNNIVISGDCCMPKFRVFIKDTKGNLVQKFFDFTDGNTFSKVLPTKRIIQTTTIPQRSPHMTSNKNVVIGVIGGGVSALAIVVLVVSVMLSRKRKTKNYSAEDINMKLKN